jgi:hypothetical protein
MALPDINEEEIQNRLALLQDSTGLDLPAKSGKPLTGQALSDWILLKESDAQKNRIERGVGYALLQKQLGHGQFQAWLTDNNIPYRTARDTIKTAELFFSLSKSNVQRAAHLPHRKIQALAGAPLKLIDEMFTEGVFDNAENMSREDIRELIKLRKEYATLQKRYENIEIKLHDALVDNAGDLPDFGIPVSMQAMRIESTALTDKANLCIDDLGKIAHQCCDGIVFAAVDKENSDAVISTLFHNVRMLAAKSQDILNQLTEVYPDQVKNPQLSMMTPSEMQDVITKRNVMMDEHGLEKTMREIQRDNAKPRGRGRPKKSAK